MHEMSLKVVAQDVVVGAVLGADEEVGVALVVMTGIKLTIALYRLPSYSVYLLINTTSILMMYNLYCCMYEQGEVTNLKH